MFVLRTNGDRLDSDTFLEMCICRVVGIFSLEDFLPAEGIDEGSSACKRTSQWLKSCCVTKLPRTSTRGTTDHQAKLNPLLDVLLSADLNL